MIKNSLQRKNGQKRKTKKNYSIVIETEWIVVKIVSLREGLECLQNMFTEYEFHPCWLYTICNTENQRDED